MGRLSLIWGWFLTVLEVLSEAWLGPTPIPQLNQSVEPKSGKGNCPECSAEFEIDARLECIFVDPKSLKLPVNGLVCISCGLVQGHENRKCVFCGVALNNTVQ